MSDISRHVALCGASLLYALFPALAIAQSTPQEDAQASPSVKLQGPGETTYLLEGSTLHVNGQVEGLELPCAGEAAVAGEHLLVECGARGVWIVSLEEPAAPAPLRLVGTGGAEALLYRVGGELWVEIPGRGAQPAIEWIASQLEPPRAKRLESPPAPDEEEPTERPPPEQPPEKEKESAGTEPAPEAPADRDQPVGEVIEREQEIVIASIGQEDGLRKGDRVEFFVTRQESLGGGQVVERERRVAGGTVVAAGAQRSRVQLDLNNAAPASARVRQVGGEAGSNLWVPRIAGVWSMELNARPFLPLGALGGGALLDGSVEYAFEAPFAVELSVSPLGFTITDEASDILTFAASLIGSYDTDLFELGLGLGVSQINTGDGEYFIEGGEETGIVSDLGFTLVQRARLGPRDGLHLSAENNFVLREGDWGFGGITLTAQVPTSGVRANTWLLARGGGGVPGHVFGELGMRVLVDGNGTSGSLFVTPTVGVGSLSGARRERCTDSGRPPSPEQPPEEVEGTCLSNFSYTGPMVGVGLEWRP